MGDTKTMAAISYELVRVFERNIPKFGIRGDEYRLRINDIPDDLTFLTVVNMMYDMFEREYIYPSNLLRMMCSVHDV